MAPFVVRRRRKPGNLGNTWRIWKRIMTRPSPLLKNTTALAVAKLIEKGASICLSFFIARYLGASALGVYAATVVFLGLLSVAAEMGSTSFLVRELSRDRSRTNSYLIHFGVMALVFSCGMIGVAFLIVPRLGYSDELLASVYVITFAIIPVVLKAIQEAAFLAHQRVEFITYTTLAGALIHVGLSLFLLHQGHGIVSVVFVYAVAQSVIVLCYFLLLNRHIARLQWDFSFPFAVQLIRQVRAFAGSSVLGGILARPEVMILSLFKNDAQIGFYSAALQIVLLWQVIPETYMRNLYPVLSRSQQTPDWRHDQPILDQSIKYLLAISLPLAIGIFVAARPIVDFLYGPGFGLSVLLVRIMALCIPLTFLFELLWRLLAARDQQNLMLRAQVVISLVRLAGGYALIAWLASTGAAVITALMILSHNLLLGFYTRRDGISLGICRQAWRLVVAALGMGTFAALLVDRSDLWIVVVAAAAFYSVLVVMLRALSPTEFALIRKISQMRPAG